MHTVGKLWVATHICNLIEITCRVHSQNLDCDLATLMLAHPHVGVPAAVQRFLQSVKAKWDLEWTRKQSVATTYPAQCVQTLPLEPRF